jgi:hypothetical protein
MFQRRPSETVVQCAHCGAVYRGDSQALVWFEAKACASSHQVKSYRYAPELKPNNGGPLRMKTQICAAAAALLLGSPGANATLMASVTDNGSPIAGCATTEASPLAVACSDAAFSSIGIVAQGTPTIPSPDLGTITISATAAPAGVDHVLDFVVTQTGLSGFAGGNGETTFTYNGLINLPGPVTYHMVFDGVDIADATLGPSAAPQTAGPIVDALAAIAGAFTDSQEILATFAPDTVARQLQANAQFAVAEAVPEPTSLVLLGAALAGMCWCARRRVCVPGRSRDGL